MPAQVTALSVGDTSCNPLGGLSHAYWGLFSDITAITATGGEVTALTVSASPAKLEFDVENDTAFLNVSDGGDNGRTLYTIDGLMSFPKVDTEKITASHDGSLVCRLYFIAVFNSGYRCLVGVDYNRENDTWKFTKKPTRIKVDVLSDTGDNSDRVDWRIIGEAKYIPLPVALDDAAIELL